MEPVELLLSKLSNANQNGGGWIACCPAHEDRKPSLSIGIGDDGRALVNCHAGCSVDAICAAVGLRVADLMNVDTTRRKPKKKQPAAPKKKRSYATAKAAISAIEKRHGKASAYWKYVNAAGDPVGVILRWNTADGKDIRPVAKHGTGWVIGGMPEPRPLYRLPELSNADVVFVVEGEKAADAAISIGLVATTSAHGSTSAGKTDWTPLAGKQVVVLPDNDAPGFAYADEVQELLTKLCPPAVVKVVHLPGLPPAGDIADWIEARTDADGQELRRQVLERVNETTVSSTPPADLAAIARDQAMEMLIDPNLIDRIADDIEFIGVAGERILTVTIYLVGTSRLLPKPLAGIIKGPTASGKSYLIAKTVSLFPPDAVLMATQMTPNALFYMPPGSLSHRFVVAGERSRVTDDDAAEATRALREMLSAGRLSKMATIRMESRLIEQEGPIAFIESTTAAAIFEEDLNRCILLHTDERASQTQRIIKRLAFSYSGSDSSDVNQIIARHRVLQNLLKPWPIVIPYADRLGELFTIERVEARRAFPQLMSMIEACALLHQYQRDSQDGRLIATADDYELARQLLSGPMSRSLGGGLSEPASRFLERLSARFEVDQKFSTTEACEHESANRRTVRGYLSELSDEGVVEQKEEGKGSRPAVWVLKKTSADEIVSQALPTADAVFDSVPHTPTTDK